ncbi:CHRNA9 [Branchiostoma lanceolatum]|uniref:CHRNA9 protein n=1 Tax=Branchiostoma lanceolatum TaxID=7740 RepID=A0A8K0EVT0_BRALA|nr:CHRNA9 [Branchiostoma lanceolatum]
MMLWMSRRGSQQGKPRAHRRRRMSHRRTRAKMNQCLPWLVTAVIMGFLCQGVDSASGEFARKLLTDLFKNYTSSIRPVKNTSRPIDVTFGVALAQIIDMDERNQILTAYLWLRQNWVDEYLQWEPADYDGLESLRVPSSLVWTPDIVLYNNADDDFSSRMETNVALDFTGHIYWDSPAITKSSCEVDVSFFPFDRQKCRLTFGSWTYSGSQIDVWNESFTGDLTDYVRNAEWELVGMPSIRNLIVYGCCPDPFPDVTFSINLERKSLYYIFNLILPCMLISMLAPMSFYLPADSGEKVSLGITVLLALTVFQLVVAEALPPSENIPLIGKYYIASMTLMSLSTGMSCFVMNIHHCGPEARPVPRWMRWLILKWLAQILLFRDLNVSCCKADKVKCRASPRMSRSGSHGCDNTNTSCARERACSLEDVMKRPDEVQLRSSLRMRSEDMLNGGRTTRNNTTNCRMGVGYELVELKPPEVMVANKLEKRLDKIEKEVRYVTDRMRRKDKENLVAAEWQRVAKVVDRLFLWLSLLTAIAVSLLILGSYV